MQCVHGHMGVQQFTLLLPPAVRNCGPVNGHIQRSIDGRAKYNSVASYFITWQRLHTRETSVDCLI